MLTFQDIVAARKRMGEAIYVPPCPYTQSLSELTGCELYLKLENLQMTGSYKERGACNKLLTLTAEERSKGVVAASAGNHAQGIAYHSRRLGIEAIIVMPETTPLVKVSATRRFGATVVLHGTNYDEAYAEAMRRVEQEGRTFVHPFNDPVVMAGQGTIGLELIEQNPYLQAVVLPIGGGGLAAGVAVAIKETNPKIRVYGVEPQVIASMKAAMQAGSPVELPAAKTIADGIAVRRVGDQTCEVARQYLDDVVTVDDEEIAQAILTLLEREKTVAEGAGAAPLAALLARRLPVEGMRVAGVVSGGNIDVNMISRVIERGLVKTGRLMRVRVRVSDQPGALASLLATIGQQRANVLEIHHDRLSQAELDKALVELVLETRGFDHLTEIEEAVRAAGFDLA
jgi:threonine dehydratase